LAELEARGDDIDIETALQIYGSYSRSAESPEVFPRRPSDVNIGNILEWGRLEVRLANADFQERGPQLRRESCLSCGCFNKSLEI